MSHFMSGMNTGTPAADSCSAIFFFNDTAPTEIYTLSLHDALPICAHEDAAVVEARNDGGGPSHGPLHASSARDRKSTRLNSSHSQISYAVFCLKKKMPQSSHSKNIIPPENPTVNTVHRVNRHVP